MKKYTFKTLCLATLVLLVTGAANAAPAGGISPLPTNQPRAAQDGARLKPGLIEANKIIRISTPQAMVTMSADKTSVPFTITGSGGPCAMMVTTRAVTGPAEVRVIVPRFPVTVDLLFPNRNAHYTVQATASDLMDTTQCQGVASVEIDTKVNMVPAGPILPRAPAAEPEKPATPTASAKPVAVIQDVKLKSFGQHFDMAKATGAFSPGGEPMMGDEFCSACNSIFSPAHDIGGLRIVPVFAAGQQCSYAIIQSFKGQTKTYSALYTPANPMTGVDQKKAPALTVFSGDETVVTVTLKGMPYPLPIPGLAPCEGEVSKTIVVHDDPTLRAVSK
jgi:hypothetical protein